MRAVVVGLVAIIALAGGFLVMSRQGAAKASDLNPYEGLRAQALRTTPANLGLSLPSDKLSVYGIVMDMGLPDGTGTLVAYSTGDASLYLSSGGGIVGGRGHAEVREAARVWIQGAQSHLASFSPTTAFERPTDGYAKFLVLTNRGVVTATASEAEIDAGSQALSPVWYAGQQLLTDLQSTRGADPKPTSTD